VAVASAGPYATLTPFGLLQNPERCKMVAAAAAAAAAAVVNNECS